MIETYALELIQNGKRVDGREFTQFRDIEIKENVIETAEGSAYVRFGNTKVIVGVKIGTGAPFPDTPNEGILSVSAEFTPLASPEFEAGPPGEDAIELARIVDRGIRESKMIELEKLAITPGEKVWSVFVDIYIIDNQGNLLDAAALASVVALMNTRLPKLDVEGNIVKGEYDGKLPVVHKPITISVCKVGDKLFLDPTKEEELVIDAKLSIAVREDDKICAMQKQGNKGIEFDFIEKMVDVAIEKSKELRKLVK
ncbi:MAG: exosome complex protein Rrp42 [Candidatus Aenigmatarchaeota archaeon]|nr:exosome complex protein Rrp42 [Candidatus Aenigmarchaeota archaeon]